MSERSPKSTTRNRKRNDGQSDENISNKDESEKSSSPKKYMLRSNKLKEGVTITSDDAPVQTRKRKYNEIDRKNAKGNNETGKCSAFSRSAKMLLQERISNESPDREFIVNEIVLVTIPGFCPWISRILNISAQTIAIEFFGTGQW